MKRFVPVILLVFTFLNAAAQQTHIVRVWDGYYQFVNPGWVDTLDVNPGDTIRFRPLDTPQSMSHTITSTSIPGGAMTFDYFWNFSSGDTLFDYIPTVPGTYDYVCTPHVQFNMKGVFRVSGTVGTAKPVQTVRFYSSGKEIWLSNGSKMNFSIFDIYGTPVLSARQSNKVSIDHLAKGIYLVRLTNDQGSGQTHKVFRY